MARVLPYCTICRRHYRGTFSAHARTVTHRHNIAVEDKRKGSRIAERTGKKARRDAAYRRVKSEDAYIRRTVVTVKRYRRSRPDDGKARTVTVRRYFRMPPGHATTTKLHQVGGAWYAVKYGNEGKARALRPANRRELRTWGIAA